MTTGTAIAQEDKSLTQILAERNTTLLDLKLTLEEFSALVTVRYDDRFGWHDWRVQGNVYLSYWIYDHVIHDREKNAPISEAAVIEAAYRRFCHIQEHRGQMNFNTVYVKDCEVIEVIPRHKTNDYATVSVVKDRLDGLYRYSTDYMAVNGGSSYAPSIHSKVTATRTEAVLCGAREILNSLESGWEAKAEPEKYNPFLNKIKAFIEKIEGEERQPSLFS